MNDSLGQIMVIDNGSIDMNVNHRVNFFANHDMALAVYLPVTADGTKMRPSLVSQESVTILKLSEPVGLVVDPKCVTFETIPGIDILS